MSNSITVPFILVPGPPGPTGSQGAGGPTTLGTGGLTMPAAGSTVTVNVGTNSWTSVNNFVAVTDSTKVTVLQVTALPSGQITLLNPVGYNTNPLQGATFAAGSTVSQGAPQVGPLSESVIGDTRVGNIAIATVNVLAGQTIVVPVQLPALAFSELISVAADFPMWNPLNSDHTGVRQLIRLRNNGGTYQDPLGRSGAAAVGIDASLPPQAQYSGATVAGAIAQMQAQGAGLVVSFTAPVGNGIWARAAFGYERGGAVTGAGAAPVVTSIGTSSGSASGGTTVPIVGSGFTGVVPTQSPGNVTIDGVAASWAVVDDSHITAVTGANSGGGGTGPVIVTHPLNGPSNTNITYTYTDDPGSILAATPPRVWLRGDSIAQVSGVISAWNDKGTFGNNVPLGTGTPTYHATGSTPNGTPTLSLASANPDTFSLASLNMGAADQGIFAWAVVKCTSAASLMELFSFGGSSANGCELLFLNGPPDAEGGARGSATWGSSTVNTWVFIWAYYDASSVGAGGTNSIDVNNGTAINSGASAGSARVQTGQLSIGRRALAFNDRPFSGEIAELGLAPFAAGVRPTAGQLTRFRTYSSTFHGV